MTFRRLPSGDRFVIFPALMGRGQAVKASGFDPVIPGSSPGAPANAYSAAVDASDGGVRTKVS
jgi:hypothetical protein